MNAKFKNQVKYFMLWNHLDAFAVYQFVALNLYFIRIHFNGRVDQWFLQH